MDRGKSSPLDLNFAPQQTVGSVADNTEIECTSDLKSGPSIEECSFPNRDLEGRASMKKQSSPSDVNFGGEGGNNEDKKKRRSGSSGEDDAGSGRPYICRFCPMRFNKSQALGGHMNRHRQEREQEQLSQAQELVYNKLHHGVPTYYQNSGPSSITRFNSRASSSLPSQQPIYHPSHLAWNQGPSFSPVQNSDNYVKQEDWLASRSTASAGANPLQNPMPSLPSYLTTSPAQASGRNLNQEHMMATPYERNNQSSQLFPTETHGGILQSSLQRAKAGSSSGLGLQCQTRQGTSASTSRFNPSLQSSYHFYGENYNLSNTPSEENLNLQASGVSSSVSGMHGFLSAPSADSHLVGRNSPDFDNVRWMYHQQRQMFPTALASMPNNEGQDYNLSLTNDTVPTTISPGEESGIGGEISGRQRERANAVIGTEGSLSFGIDYNANEGESKFK